MKTNFLFPLPFSSSLSCLQPLARATFFLGFSIHTIGFSQSVHSSQASEYAPAKQQFSGTQTTRAASSTNQALPLDHLNLPEGFQIEVFASVLGARSLAVSADGIVVVGTGGFSDVDPQGRVTAILPLADGSRRNVVIATGLDNPNGVAIEGDDVYIAERTRVSRLSNILSLVRQSRGTETEILIDPETIRDDFPLHFSHGWKYLGLGPDNKLYVPKGGTKPLRGICAKINSRSLFYHCQFGAGSPFPYRLGLSGKV